MFVFGCVFVCSFVVCVCFLLVELWQVPQVVFVWACLVMYAAYAQIVVGVCV